ncbi:MAG: saccharopine dehydrogenase NADP-binding domain-containing protein [Candidatus Moduliflexus flocculans]|nr:saccharopine dehydrogenase NADP-binding domain-containing protein [Candidatus Moduliflexus flocculans]
MKKIVVLGAGMVGRVMAADLAPDFEVTSVDVSPANLGRLEGTPVKRLQADLSSAAAVRGLVRDCDLVVGAVPGSMGFATLEAVIAAGKDVVDISFFPEDAFLPRRGGPARPA